MPHCFLCFSACYLIGMRLQVSSACVCLGTLDYAFTESPALRFSLSSAGVHLHPPFLSHTAYAHGACTGLSSCLHQIHHAVKGGCYSAGTNCSIKPRSAWKRELCLNHQIKYKEHPNKREENMKFPLMFCARKVSISFQSAPPPPPCFLWDCIQYSNVHVMPWLCYHSSRDNYRLA